MFFEQSAIIHSNEIKKIFSRGLKSSKGNGITIREKWGKKNKEKKEFAISIQSNISQIFVPRKQIIGDIEQEESLNYREEVVEGRRRRDLWFKKRFSFFSFSFSFFLFFFKQQLSECWRP